MNQLHPVKLAIAITAMLTATFAWACFWDSDTLRTEAQGVPGVVEAITGFFPVFPDTYYERRIEIARQRIAADPTDLEAYDNLAVSLDRLGDSGAAIEAIAPKRSVVESLGEEAGEHLYRSHANLGTFHAHRWIRDGASVDDLSDLELAQAHIAKAIEINPEAHFGREFVQLAAIEWLLDPEAHSFEKMYSGAYPSLLGWLQKDGSREQFSWHTEYREGSQEGLVGLITLGAAEESVDVISALGLLMLAEEHSSLAFLCGLRLEELREAGRESIHPIAFQENYARPVDRSILGSTLSDGDQADVEAYFSEARRAADAFRAQHAAFIQSRLDAGLHPDTHDDFFAGEPVALLPEMPHGTLGRGGFPGMIIRTLLTIAGVLTTVVPLVIVCRKYSRSAQTAGGR